MFTRIALRISGAINKKRNAERRKAADRDFPDLIRYIASCLRAGLSLRQAITESSERISGPVGREIKIAAGEINAGLPVEDVLTGLASRSGFSDAAVMTGILKSSIKYGGDTAGALDRLSAAVTRRNIMRAEVRALTSQARYSAVILSVLPVAFFAAFPAPAAVIFSAKGAAAISIGLGLNISGYLVLRFISDPERLL
jgi:tight adherence protein B